MEPDEIRAIRKELGLSRTELAKVLGIGRTVTSHWELGIRKPSKMALAFLNHLRECRYQRQDFMTFDDLLTLNVYHPLKRVFLCGKVEKTKLKRLKVRA